MRPAAAGGITGGSRRRLKPRIGNGRSGHPDSVAGLRVVSVRVDLGHPHSGVHHQHGRQQGQRRQPTGSAAQGALPIPWCHNVDVTADLSKYPAGVHSYSTEEVPTMPTSHQHHDRQTTSWAMAAQATLHCLTGCAIGEVLGMVIGTALGLHNASTVVLSVALAFVFGYGLTMRGILRAGVPLRAAVATALAADTVSIAVMEIIDNGVIVAVPGAMDAGLSSALFWGSLLFSLVLAFVLTTPVNRWMISRGKGHAVVHAMHH